MRTFRDRFRHVLMFEILLISVCTPLLGRILHSEATHVGALSIGLSITAMACNALYNYVFDRVLLAVGKPLYPRSLRMRIGHSIAFEVVLLVPTVPLVMWWMDFSFVQALAMDLVFAAFVPVYALGFNWIYDLVFPAPAAQES